MTAFNVLPPLIGAIVLLTAVIALLVYVCKVLSDQDAGKSFDGPTGNLDAIRCHLCRVPQLGNELHGYGYCVAPLPPPPPPPAQRQLIEATYRRSAR